MIFMKKNVGFIDSHIRLSCGIFMVSWGIVRKSPLMIGLGAMKVTEGVTRWCPVLHSLGISSESLDQAFDNINKKAGNAMDMEDSNSVKVNFEKTDNQVPDATV